MEGKRGAVELSITTIVVVVIGVTLLVLGLTFVYNIFGDIGEQQKKLGEFTDEQIRDIFSESDQSLNIPTTDFTVKIGEIFNLDMVIKNNEQGIANAACQYTLRLEGADGAVISPWIRYSAGTLIPGGVQNIRITPGNPVKIRAQIKPPRGSAALGTYVGQLNLYNDYQDTGASQTCGSGAQDHPVHGIPISITVV